MKFMDSIETPIGRLHILVSDTALLRVYFPKETVERGAVFARTHPLILRTKNELNEYFAGKRRKFSVPCAPKGTVFQMKAWQVLKDIPYGDVITYSEQAQRMKNRGAARAVGSANRKNPIPIIIPCHRVAPKGGGPGGYSGGMNTKKYLLNLEKIS